MPSSSKRVISGIYRLTVATTLVVLVGLSVWRIVGIFKQEIIANDTAVFAQMAHVLLRSDATLYVDFWDHKPPGIYFFTAPFIAVFGNTTLAIHLAALTMLILFVTGIALCTQALVQKRSAAMTAAVLALYYGLLIVYPRILETVFLMTTCATWSFYLAAAARGRPFYLIASGVMFACAVLSKQPIAFNLITLIAFSWLLSPKNKGWRSLIFIGIGGALTAGSVLVWSLKSGNFDEMWLYSTVANVRFSLGSDGQWLLGNDGYYLFRHTLPTLLPIILISLLTSYLLMRRKNWTLLLLLWSWVIPGTMGAFLARGMTLNYFYQIVPPLIILSAAIVPDFEEWSALVKTGCVVAGTTLLLALPYNYLHDVTTYFIPTEEHTKAVQSIVDYLTAHTDDDDCIWLWGEINSITYYSHRLSCNAAPHPGVVMIAEAFDIQRYRIEYIEDLLEHPPSYHVFTSAWWYYPMLEKYAGRYLREAIPGLGWQVYRVDASSWRPISVHYQDLFTMIGIDKYPYSKACAGGHLNYAMTWRVHQPPGRYYQMFAQLRNSETHETIASLDLPPLDNYPTQDWLTPGEIVLGDNFRLAIPDAVVPGDYYVATGFYNTDTLERLEIRDDSGTVIGTETQLDTVNISTTCPE